MWYSDSEGDSTVSEEAAELNSYLAENDMLGIKAREVKTLDSRWINFYEISWFLRDCSPFELLVTYINAEFIIGSVGRQILHF